MRPQRTDVHPWGEAITLGDLLLNGRRTRRPRPTPWSSSRSGWTYAQAAERARTLARGLIGLGVGPGDRVGVLMANSPDSIASIFAIALAGATVVPINTRYRAVELPFVVADAGVRVIVTSDRIDDYVDLLGLLTRRSETGRAAAAGTCGARRRARRRRPRPGTLSEADFLALAETRPGRARRSAAPPCACATTRCCSTRAARPRSRAAAASRTRRSCATGRSSRRSCASPPATACGRRARSSTSARSGR